MHVGRRTGNPVGGSIPVSIPLSFAPDSPFLDMRLVSRLSSVIRVWVESPRFEFLMHLFKNGEWRQTKNVQFTPVTCFISFQIKDTGGGSFFTASLFRRDDPLSIISSTKLELTGIGIIEVDSLNSIQNITSLGGGWFEVIMFIGSDLGDQFKLNFSILGGNTLVGDPEISCVTDKHLRLALTKDMTKWSLPLTPNGLTPSSAVAYDLLNGNSSNYKLFKFIIDFDEQVLGTGRSTFSAAISGPNLSTEGRDIEARGLLDYCQTNRIHLKWGEFENKQSISSIIVESSKTGAAFSVMAEIPGGSIKYVTPELQKGVFRFRLRSKDVAGNISSLFNFANFNPLTWFDTIDSSVVFTNIAGTIPAESDQDKIARIDSKGSLAVSIQQTVLANRPLFVYEGINHGAGLKLNGLQFHMDGGPAAAWLGAGQAFDIYMSAIFNSIPNTNPPNSLNTIDFTNIFSFNGFVELIAAKFDAQYFNPYPFETDYNTGYAIIVRMFTGSGIIAFALPIILEEITTIRLAYTSPNITFNVNNNVVVIPAPAPVAPTNVLIWGQPSPAKGIKGFVGPVVTFNAQQTNQVSEQILSLLKSESAFPTTFIIPEEISAPAGMTIGFSGMNGNVSCAPSSTTFVTQYNLYHNNGTNEFPDFSVPAMVSASPAFVVPMTVGFWRLVIRASDGIKEDGNFENRLDLTVTSRSPGLLQLAGSQPNPVSQFTVNLKPAGFVEFNATYHAWREEAVGNSVHVWIFPQNVPPDFSSIPSTIMPIPSHDKGLDIFFTLTSTILGPFSELAYYAAIKVQSSDGDFETRNNLFIPFTPDATPPIGPVGLRGNPC